jgi:hypothetical protein
MDFKPLPALGRADRQGGRRKTPRLPGHASRLDKTACDGSPGSRLFPRLARWQIGKRRVGIDAQVGDRGFECGIRFEGAVSFASWLDRISQAQPDPGLVARYARQLNSERLRHLREPQQMFADAEKLKN